MTRISDLRDKWLAAPEVRQEYDALETEFALASALIAARTRAGLSQRELAERMGTSQSAVARMESGRTMPSGRLLARYAEATGSRLKVELCPVEPRPGQ